MKSFLHLPISQLHMVGDSYSQRLQHLDIFTVEDLLHYYPFRYEDRSLVTDLQDFKDGDTITVSGTILGITNIRTRQGKQLQKATFVTHQDDTLEVTWFNQPYLVNNFTQHPQVTLSGKIKYFRDKPTLTSPSYEKIPATSSLDNNTHPSSSISNLHTGTFVPIYHLTYGLTSKWLRSRIAPLLKDTVTIEDHLPATICQQEKLVSLKTALTHIHFPQDTNQLEEAKKRLKFDELLILQLTAQLQKKLWHQKQLSNSFHINQTELDKFITQLPFKLTSAQHRSLEQIINDLKKPVPMNRLLQGDVGSGKTVIAAASAYICTRNNLTAVIMAPTEVLALQHSQSITQLLHPFNLNISTQTRSRRDDLTRPDIIIGTHAILHRQIPTNLGLLVIDEQHRFGVEQRAQLLKQPNHTPHLLSMTATPIPRTIALTLYADLDISVIDELPPGRQPITTWVVSAQKRQGAYNWIRDQILQHHTQAFIVCPFIQDSENPELDQVKAAESEFVKIRDEIYPDLRIGLVHGGMSSKQKHQAITDFAQHQTDILVATPVIEVGIDIPNASIMLIEGAERFGLAALHQLRGRVGRGSAQSYCLLMSTSGKIHPRLKHLETIHQGIKLAELDLQTRGAGNLYGTQQSGHIELKIASFDDQELITATHLQAVSMLDTDPDLESLPLLKEKLNSHLAKVVHPN